MMLTTSPSQFRLNAVSSVNYISKAGGLGRDPRRFLATGYPSGSYNWSPGNESYVIYDGYNSIVPPNPALPTTGQLMLKPNLNLSMHSFTVNNNYPSGGSISNLKSYRVRRRIDTVNNFYFYPNYNHELLSDSNIYNTNQGFVDSLNPFLEDTFNHSILPSRYSVQLYISWCRWGNKVRMPAPTYQFAANNYGRRWYPGTTPATPTPSLALAYLHSVYLYK